MLFTKSTQLASWILYPFVLTVYAQSGCTYDDCYNALFPCESANALAEALSYCSTVGRYGATNYPARATAACGNSNKRAYMSACACNVACPSVLSNTESCTSTSSTPSTLATSIRASGYGQPSFSSPTLITSASSASAFSSLGSSISGSATSVSPTLSSNATVSSEGTDPSSLDPASNTGTVTSDPGPLFSVTSTMTTPIQSSQGSVSASVNVSMSSSHTSSRLSSGPTAVSQSTTALNTTGIATASLGSSSVHWTNTTSTNGTPTSFDNPNAPFSTSLDPSVTSNSSSGSISLSLDSVTSTSLASSETLSTFPASPPTFTPASGITESASFSSDTTCTPTPSHSSFYHYLNSTTSHPIPIATGGIFSIKPTPPASSTLNHTRTRTPTSSTPSSTTSPSPSPSCTPTDPTSPTSIENGDFEQGLSPWSIDLIDILSTRYSTASPGAANSCRAFRVHMRRNTQTDDLRSNLRLVSPMVSISSAPPPNLRWNVSFWVRWVGSATTTVAESGSYLLVYANYALAHRVDAMAEEDWTRVEFPLAAGGERNLQLVFSFVLGVEAVESEVWVDEVAMDLVDETGFTMVAPVVAVETAAS